jgi:hypothetical protein
MKKFTFKLFVVAIAMLIGTVGMAQVTMEPEFASATDEITLTLNVAKSCPDNALLKADSIMMHSGVTIDGSSWSNVVEYNGEGANGLRPKFEFIGQSVPGAITITPGDATAWDTITLTLNTKLSCPADALFGADSVMMHSGVNGWSNVVEYNGEGANGQKPKLTDNNDSTWSITFVPGEFYGLEAGTEVTVINCVFNNGTWDAEGKDTAEDGSCTDFNIPFGTDDIYLWAFTFIPADYYPIEAGATIQAIDFVFNGGAWDQGEAKAFDEDGGCVDFKLWFDGLSVGEDAEQKFVLFPNPVENELNLDNLNDANIVEVYSVTGQLVKVANVGSGSLKIDVSDLQSGVYFVNVHSDKGTQSSKFIKN